MHNIFEVSNSIQYLGFVIKLMRLCYKPSFRFAFRRVYNIAKIYIIKFIKEKLIHRIKNKINSLL